MTQRERDQLAAILSLRGQGDNLDIPEPSQPDGDLLSNIITLRQQDRDLSPGIDPRLTEADALEQQASQPYPQPKGFKENLLAGIQAGLEGFTGGYTGKPGYFEHEAQRQAQYQRAQQDRLARAKAIRDEARQVQQDALKLLRVSGEEQQAQSLQDYRNQALDLERQKAAREKYASSPSGVFNTETGLGPNGQPLTPKVEPPKHVGNYVNEEGKYVAVFQHPDGSFTEQVFSKVRPQATATGEQLTPEAIQGLAGVFQQTNQLPTMGMGAAAASNRNKVFNEAFKPGSDQNPAANAATYKADSGALKKLTENLNATEAFEKTALANLDMYLKQAEKVVDTGSPLMNAPLRSINVAGFGNKEQAGFEAARQVASTEVARILASANLSGQLTDSQRREVEQMFAPNATLAQMRHTVDVLKQDMANRRAAYRSQQEEIQGRLRGSSSSSPTSSSSSGGRPPLSSFEGK